MKIRIREGNIFNENLNDAMLVHCISRDLAMGQGIAKEIDKKFGIKKILSEPENKAEVDRCLGNSNVLFVRTKKENTLIVNLITKERYYDKPTLETLRLALESFRMYLLSPRNQYNKIFMPKIGTLRDKLDWNDVLRLIREVFSGMNIEINVVDLR